MKQPPPQTDLGADLARARKLLTQRFCHKTFLPGQEESFRSILSKRNLLVVMPTGSGKSLLYQLPALLEEGLTLVVSPLISLMKDQVDELRRKGIPATFVNSSLGIEEQRARLTRCLRGEVSLLYIAPERFRNASFLNMLGRIKVSRMAVDEAHCISEWGHDFRPDYRRLKEFLEQMGKPLVTALTATATVRVQQDIIESLGLAPDQVDVQVHGFDRPNLVLSVVNAFTDGKKNDFLLEFITQQEGSGIIYAGTRRCVEELGEVLRIAEPRTAIYHAGLEPEPRIAAQNAFITGQARVVVATSAFGMGIDKADVRFVVHYDYPGSVEQYYQEIGRAGRDGLVSRCVLLYSPADRSLREFFIDLNYPGPELVKSVYEALWKIDSNPVMMTYKQIARRCEETVKDGQVGAAVRLLDAAGITRALSGRPMVAITIERSGSELLAQTRGPQQRLVLEALSATADLGVPGRYEVGLNQLCFASGLSEEQVRRALAALDHGGVIKYEPPFRGRGIEKAADPPPPFKELPIDWKRQTLLRQAEEEKLAAIERYISYSGCRRECILRYFGEKDSLRCGTCDNCNKPKAVIIEGTGVLSHQKNAAEAVLLCISHLRFPLGRDKVAQILTGSRSKKLFEWGLDRNPTYGLFQIKQESVKSVIDELIREGYLEPNIVAGRPVLALTSLGKKSALDANLDDIDPAGPKRTGSVPARNIHTTEEEISLAVLKCVSSLHNPVGVIKVAEILSGSNAKWISNAGADRLDEYGSLDTGQGPIREVINLMLETRLLRKAGNDRYPVLQLTTAGRSELERLKTFSFEPTQKDVATHGTEQVASSAQGTSRISTSSSSLARTLEAMIHRLLLDDPNRVKEMLPDLRMFHPSEIAERLILNFDVSGGSREQARVVWAVGELCSQYGLEFLTRIASSKSSNIRRLAASALGKIARAVGKESIGTAELMKRAQQVLLKLVEDPAPQVRQYARSSLEHFSPREPAAGDD